MAYSLKHKIGAIIYEGPKFLFGMMRHRPRGFVASPWKFICNRNEILIPDHRGLGVKCGWRWTSDLHIPRVFPALGLRLMKRAFSDWPVGSVSEPLQADERVDVTFIIGHRGTARLPHLLATLRSIAAQRGASIECLVVEQAVDPEIKSFLPDWVRYIHARLPQPDMPYCRSSAFNAGASLARGHMLVLHDNDLIVPESYAAEILKRASEGYEVINLKRFIFYLSEMHSQRVFSAIHVPFDEAPEAVTQNAQGGGSLAITREAYFAIGGFDEAFVGWGGEDNEFWERAQTRKVWPFGYLPLIHLWHPAQPGKLNQSRQTTKLFEMRSAIPVEERIKELITRNLSRSEHLTPASGSIANRANSK